MGTHVVVGLSHREARLDQLERYWVPPAQRVPMAEAMVARGCAEALVLSTCARTELHAILEPVTRFGTENVVADLLDLLETHGRRRRGGLSGEDWLVANAFAAANDEATTHLFRVVAGLDSRVPGEREIRAQVQAAAHAAVASPGRRPERLRELTAAAIGAARRFQTAEGAATTSMVLARRAVDLALASGGLGEAPATVAVVGAGTMGRQIVDLLSQRGLPPTRVPRGSVRDGHSVADAGYWPRLGTALRTSDVVVFATSAQQRVLTQQVMETVMQQRAGRPITLLDLALPRNVAPAVRTSPNVRLIDLDEIQSVGSGTTRIRTAEGHAVDEAAARYCRSVRARRAGPLIAVLRRHLEQRCNEELRRHLGTGTFSEDSLCRAATALARTIAHAPTVLARDAAADDDPDALRLLAMAFNLPPVAAPMTTSPSAPLRHRPVPYWALGPAEPAL